MKDYGLGGMENTEVPLVAVLGERPGRMSEGGAGG